MIYNTKGIVLRTIKYGESSIVVSVFTELFGIQSYIVNGIRTSAKTTYKASQFQPSSILEMEVYHNDLKNLQRIKECKWSYLYKSILTNVIKNSVAVYMIELLQKCLKQPEKNTILFKFVENAFLQLDTANDGVTANFAIYFALKLVYFFGFSIHNNYAEDKTILDLQDGTFVQVAPSHSYFLEEKESRKISQVLKVDQVSKLAEVQLNKSARIEMLLALQTFYGLHIPEFGTMKTLPILQDILS